MNDSPRWSGGPASVPSVSGGPISFRAGGDRFGVRCSRCARTQPGAGAPAFAGLPGQPRYAGAPTPRLCVYCGGPLAVEQWIAIPPPGFGPAPSVRRIRRPYTGPPSYGASHPTWGFPPVAQRPPMLDSAPPPSPPLRLTSVSVVAAVAVALAAGIAAGAEIWRYRLMLTGRFEVMPAEPVRINQAAVTATSWVTFALAALALVAVTRTVQQWSMAAAARAGMAPPRTVGAIGARMLVPGWNLYGAGQAVLEAQWLIRAARPGEPGTGERSWRILAGTAWVAWIANGVLAAVVAVLSVLPLVSARWAASNQLAANLVVLHIALDALAAVVAVLAAAVLNRLRTQWLGGKPQQYAGWVVAQPPSSARNRVRAATEHSPADDGSDTGDVGDSGDVRGRPATSADARGHAGQHRRRQ